MSAATFSGTKTKKERHLRSQVSNAEQAIEKAFERLRKLKVELKLYLNSPEYTKAILEEAKEIKVDHGNRVYCGKQLFESKRLAHMAMSEINAQINSNRFSDKKKLLKRVYYCEKCDAFHLTSKELKY